MQTSPPDVADLSTFLNYRDCEFLPSNVAIYHINSKV